MTRWKRPTGSWTPELGPTAAKSLWRAFMFSSIVFPCQLCHIEDGQINTKMQLHRKSFLQSHCGLMFCTLYQWWKLLSTAGWRSSDRDVLSLFVLVNSGSLVALFFSGLMWISYLPSNFNSSFFLKIVLVVKLVRGFCLFDCFFNELNSLFIWVATVYERQREAATFNHRDKCGPM